MATPLSDVTADLIVQLFSSADRELVSTLLLGECGDHLPLLSSADSAAIERIRFAVLKLSGGDNALQRSVDLAKTDWRDVLVAASFDSDVESAFPMVAGCAGHSKRRESGPDSGCELSCASLS
jgi:hypothetical protein